MLLRRSIIAIALMMLVFIGVIAALSLDNYFKEKNLDDFSPEKHKLYSYKIEGESNKKVLFIHGLAASSSFWQPVLSKLPDDTQALVPDLLGFGNSPKPIAEYDLDDHVAALRPLLESSDFLNGEPMIVVGHSMGTLIALQLAKEFPDKISGLVLISLPHFPTPESAKNTLKQVSWMHRGMITGNPILKTICYALHGRDFGFEESVWGLPANVINAGGQHNWHSVNGSLLNSVVNVDALALLNAVNQPIRFLHGSNDSVAPLHNLEVLLSEVGRQKDLYVVDGAVHSFPLSYPMLVVDEIDRVITRTENMR